MVAAYAPTTVDAESQVTDAISIEPAHESVAIACHILSRHGVKLRVHDVERAADGLDVERVKGVPRCSRDGRVCEREAGSGL